METKNAACNFVSHLVKVVLLVMFIKVATCSKSVKSSMGITPSQVETGIEQIFERRGFTVRVNIQRFPSNQYDILITYIDYDTSFTPTLGINTVLEEFVKGSVSQTGALNPDIIDWKLGHLYMISGDSVFGIDTDICRKVIYYSHRKEEDKAVNLYKDNLERNTSELKERIKQFIEH